MHMAGNHYQGALQNSTNLIQYSQIRIKSQNSTQRIKTVNILLLTGNLMYIKITNAKFHTFGSLARRVIK